MVTRVLHYNWAQFDDPEKRGGGVSVYLRNLFNALVDDPNYELTMLSSGHHYTYFDRKTRYEQTDNIMSAKGVRTFRILNSPVKAPAHDMFYDIGEWRYDAESARVFAEVLRAQGPFDAVVLHSLEGISAEVLALKEEFPQIKFYYMWHNYMPLCPQIELLYQNREDCRDFDDGRKCQGCISGFHKRDQLIVPQRFGSSLEFARLSGRPMGNFLFGAGLSLYKLGEAVRFLLKDMRNSLKHTFSRNEGVPARGGFQSIELNAHGPGPSGRSLDAMAARGGDYRAWRDVNTMQLNKFDGHLCVSQLVADTITGFGIDPKSVHVTPLGMDLHANASRMRQEARKKRARDRKPLRLSFIGYGIPSKGLPFITDALMQVDSPIFREKVELIVYARLSDHQMLRLTPLLERFSDVRVVQGYDRRDLAKIATDIDLNIVPSIWRETYNQVAYELLCLGTPSLISSSVGLGMFYQNSPDFVFKSGSETDFIAKLHSIVANPDLLDKFWLTPPELPSMDQHMSMALRAMGGDKRKDV